jgi:hypothetical protein
MNSLIKNTRVLAVIFGLLFVAGCTTDQQAQFDMARTQYVAIVPPDTLYACPAKPPRPTAPDGKIKDSQVAEFLVKLDHAHSICSKSLKAIKAFAAQAKLKVENVQ